MNEPWPVHFRVDLTSFVDKLPETVLTIGACTLPILLIPSNARTVRRKLAGPGDDDDGDNRGIHVAMTVMMSLFISSSPIIVLTPKPVRGGPESGRAAAGHPFLFFRDQGLHRVLGLSGLEDRRIVDFWRVLGVVGCWPPGLFPGSPSQRQPCRFKSPLACQVG